MALKIISIKNDTEDIVEEHVTIKATEDIPDLSVYAIYDMTFSNDGTISNKNVHLFRFPKMEIKKGNIVYLYTGKNTTNRPVFIEDKEKPENNKYRLYQNYDRKIWNKDHDKATLVKIINEYKKDV